MCEASSCFDPPHCGSYASDSRILRITNEKGSSHHELHPQVETLEISDADLDNVSGGLVGGLAANLTGTADSIVPVSGVVGGLTGTVEGLTGVNTAAVTGLATGLTAGL